MGLPISQDVLSQELGTLKSILDKWHERVQQGIPGVNIPMTGCTPPEYRLEVWLNELIGELRLVGGKSHNVAEILSSTIID